MSWAKPAAAFFPFPHSRVSAILFYKGGLFPPEKYFFCISIETGRGRTGHDLGIYVTRRSDLHGLHPERYVRFPFVRNVSRVGIFGFFVLFVLLVLLTCAESGGSVQGA